MGEPGMSVSLRMQQESQRQAQEQALRQQAQQQRAQQQQVEQQRYQQQQAEQQRAQQAEQQQQQRNQLQQSVNLQNSYRQQVVPQIPAVNGGPSQDSLRVAQDNRRAQIAQTRTAIPRQYQVAFDKFMMTATDLEQSWFTARPETFQIVGKNGGERLDAAKNVRSAVRASYASGSAKRQLNHALLADYEAYKRDLIKEVGWRTSDSARAVNVIARTMVAISSLILELIPTSVANEFSVNVVYGAIVDILKEGDIAGADIAGKIESAMHSAAISDLSTRGHVLLALAASFGEFGANLIEIDQSNRDQDSLRAEIIRQIEMIDLEIAKIKEENIVGTLEYARDKFDERPSYVINVNKEYAKYIG